MPSHNGTSAAGGSNGAQSKQRDPEADARRREEQRVSKALKSAEIREEQFIGAALFDLDTCRLLREVLVPDDFKVPSCRAAFLAICEEMEADPDGITPAAIARRMQRARPELSDGREALWLDTIRLGSPGQQAALVEARAVEDERKKRDALDRVVNIVGKMQIAGTFAETCQQIMNAVGGYHRGTDVLSNERYAPPRFLPAKEAKTQDGDLYVQDAFPPWFANYAEACAHTQSSSLDLCVQIGLAAMSSALAPWFNVSAKIGWTEPCLLWTLGLMPSGGKKTPVMREMWASRHWYQAELTKHRRQLASVLKVTAAAKKKVISKLQLEASDSAVRLEELSFKVATTVANYGASSTQAEATRNMYSEEEQKHYALLQRVAAEERNESSLKASMSTPQVFFNNATAESFWSHTPYNPGNYACVLDDEGDIFAGKARYADGGNDNEAVFLAGFEGMTHFPSRVEEPGKPRFPNLGAHTRIELHQMIQSAKMMRLCEKADLNEKGFLNRFVFFWPGEQNFAASNRDTIPSDIAEEYVRRTRGFYTDTIEWQMREIETKFPRVIRFSEGAATAFFGWVDEFDPRHKSKNGDLFHINGWASKFPTTIMKLSLIMELLWHCPGGIGDLLDPKRTVCEDSVRRAIMLSGVLIDHAVHTFNKIGSSSTEPSHDAEVLMRQVNKRGKGVYTMIELERLVKWDRASWYMNPAQVKGAVNYLLKQGILDAKQNGKEVSYTFRAVRPGRDRKPRGAT